MGSPLLARWADRVGTRLSRGRVGGGRQTLGSSRDCRASNVVDAGGATMSRYEETAEPGEAGDAVDMALSNGSRLANRVLEPHVLSTD